MKRLFYPVAILYATTALSQQNDSLKPKASVYAIGIAGGGWHYQNENGTRFNAGLEISLRTKSKYFYNTVSFHMIKRDYYKTYNLVRSYNQLTVGKTFHLEKGVFFTDIAFKTGLYYYDFKSFNHYIYSLGIPFNGSPEAGLTFDRFSISGGYNFFFTVGLRRAYTGNIPEYPNSQGLLADMVGAGFIRLNLKL